MQVRDGMSTVVLTVGPDHTLRQAAEQMSRRSVGAAVVMDPDGEGPGILTERDILISVGKGQNIDDERVCDHLTASPMFATSHLSTWPAPARDCRPHRTRYRSSCRPAASPTSRDRERRTCNSS